MFLAFFLLCLLFCPACIEKKLDNSLHLVIFENPKSLDPVRSSEVFATEAIGSIYETFLQYHYLKRPYVLVPLLAQDMPTYSKDGLTVTLKLKPHVLFQDDPCFKDGKGRELTVRDFIYGFKRLADPKNQSDGWFVLDGKIEGLNEWRDENANLPTTNYASEISGLKVVDDLTLRIKLKKKYPQLNYVLAMNYTSPMPHEALEKYGPEISNHPVGTGAFVMTEYIRGSHITFDRNRNFHGETFPMPEQLRLPSGCDTNPPSPIGTCKTGETASASKLPAPVTADLDYGKSLPLSDHIVLHIFLERQPAWLAFMKGGLDWMTIPKDNYSQVIAPDHNLQPFLSEKGVKLSKDPSTTEWFIGYNFDDPLLGKNPYLRKAIGYAYDIKRDIDLFTNGIASPSNQILPPSIAGYDSKISPREFDLQKAKDLLVKAGFPGGKGLPPLFYDVEGSSNDRQLGEFFKSQMDQVGIPVTVRVNTRPELMDRKRKGKLQVHMDGWIADYPDAENFMQLLYGPNHPPGPNNSAFNNPEFNKLYEQMAGMAPSPERQKIIDRMNQIFAEESPWTPRWIAMLYHVHQDWMKNYIYSDFAYNSYKYYRVDFERKKELLKKF